MRFLPLLLRRVESEAGDRRARTRGRGRDSRGRGLRLEPLEDRSLLAVALNWSGPGAVLSLTENVPGATPAIVISEPSPNVSLLTDRSGRRACLRRRLHDHGDRPDLRERRFAHHVAVRHDRHQRCANNYLAVQAALPGDSLTLGPIRDSLGGIGSIAASAESIAVPGVSTYGYSSNGNVDLRATGNLTVDSGAIIQTGSGTILLAADVKADGGGDDGVGTLSIGPGHGLELDQFHGRRHYAARRRRQRRHQCQAGVGRWGAFTTPTATLTGLNYPEALAFDSSDNLYVANWGNDTVSKFAPGSTTPTPRSPG